MNCKHDPMYRQNNESAGGAGCPLCAAERRKAAQRPVYDAHSHTATVAARMDQVAPDVDLNDMRDTTGTWTMPQTVEERCLLNLINNDQGMMGDRG